MYTALSLLAVITVVLFWISFEYEDTDSLTAWSLNFWDLFFKGRLGRFYEYTALNVHGAAHANCGGNYLWLLPLCIWNFPLWVVHSVGGIASVQNIYSICWSKLFWLVLQAVTAYAGGRICAVVTDDPKRIFLTEFLIMASPEMLMSTGYAGQDEIVYVCLFTIAFYCLMRGYWKRCYLLLVCCVSFCPIMLIPALALLLWKEKRLYRLAAYTAGTLLPLLLFELIYRNDAVYQSCKHGNDFQDMLLEMLSGLQIDGAWGLISLSGVAVCVLFFVCYVENVPQNGGRDDQRKILYIVTLLFMTISFFMVRDYYRMLIYVPFLVLLLTTSEQDMGNNLFLLTVVTYGRIFQACGGSFPKSLNTCYVMKNSWLTRLCDMTGSKRYLADPEYCTCLWAHIIKWGDLGELIQIMIETCVIGGAALLLVINGSSYKKRYAPMFREKVMLTIYTICMPFILACYYMMLLH